MKKSYLLLIACFSLITTTYAQKILGSVIDANSLKPIELASIMTDLNTGTITNAEGNFSIITGTTKYLTFSCLGYETKTISLKKLKELGYKIQLAPKSIVLEEITLNADEISVDSLISRVKQHATKNYHFDYIQHSLFLRESHELNAKKLNFNLKKSSFLTKEKFKKIRHSFDSISNKIKQNTSVSFIEFKGDYHLTKLNNDKRKSKLTNVQAYKIDTQKTDFSLEGIGSEVQRMFFSVIDSDKSYKVKTGLFKIDDNASIGKEISEPKTHFENTELKSKAKDVLKNTDITNNLVANIMNPNLYSYQIKDRTYNNDDLIYIVQFKPRKSKAKFSGSLYINMYDYSIIKIEYQYGKRKRGEHLNLKLLLGFKYEENVKEGTIIFQKDKNETYFPLYIKEKTGISFYFNRPFKFIENSNKRNKVKFSVKFSGIFYKTSELLVTNSSTISHQEFQEKTEVKEIPYTSLEVQNYDQWKGENALLPNKQNSNIGS